MVFDDAGSVTVKVQVAGTMEEIAAAGRVIAGSRRVRWRLLLLGL